MADIGIGMKEGQGSALDPLGAEPRPSFSPMTWQARASAALARADAWSLRHLLVWSVLEQGVVALVLLGAVRLLSRRALAPLFTRADRLGAPMLRRAMRAVVAVLPWFVLALAAAIAAQAFSAFGSETGLLTVLASFALAWCAIRLISVAVRDPKLAVFFAVCAWVVAALNIVGLLGATGKVLNGLALTVGTLRVSVLLVLKGAVLLTVLIWLASTLARLAEQRLQRLPEVSPAMQVLAVKLLRFGLVALAVVLSLGAVGIDLTAFAVFSGAIGVGIGLGLQKVVSNLVSGVILLLDRSIKPGDVIEIEGTYGWITRLNARYVSVATRNGTEFLIPNEDLITQRVINWSYSNELIRLHVPIGISYHADPHAAIATCVEAASGVARVLAEPAPVCLLTAFGDSTVNLELRFWIKDPRNGTANCRSAVMLRVWDLFRARGVELPFPQLDVHVSGKLFGQPL